MERPKNITDQQWQTALEIYDSAKRQGDKYPELTVAQAALETGWFKKPSGKNNYFGQKATANQAGTTLRTTEVSGNKEYKINDKFRDYDTIDEAVADRIKKWGSKYQDAENVEDAISKIWKYDSDKGQGVGYATDPEYGSKVKSILGTLGTTGLPLGNTRTVSQTEAPDTLDFNPPQITGEYQTEEQEQEETQTEEQKPPKRTEKANELAFVADAEEMMQSQPQRQFIQQDLVEGVAYQPIQEFQDGGTWQKQKNDLRNERLEQLKALKDQPKPTYSEKKEEIKQETNQKKVDNVRVIPKNNPEKISRFARNKTDQEIAEERQFQREQADNNPLNKGLGIFNPENWSRENWAETAQGLESQFRVSDEPNFFDDYINPANMIGTMSANLGQAPLRAEQSDSYTPYFTAVGAPLAVGALAGIGAKTTGQFVNNLANPLAGTGDLVNKLGNKYLPNASKLNPYAFKASEDMGYRMLGKEGYQDAIESGVLRAKPTPNQPVSGGISLTRNTNRNPNTGKMQGALDRPYFADGFIDERYAADYMAAVNKADNNLVPIPTHKGIAPSQTGSIPLDNAIIYKKDWLQGYKQVDNGVSNPFVPLYRTQDEKYQDGGVKVDPQGYWNKDNRGNPVIIPSPSISMKNIDFTVLGTSLETGEQKIMKPGQNYFFKNTQNVLEKDFFQAGGQKIRVDIGDGETREISTQSDEYRRLYNAGQIVSQSDGMLYSDLDEVVVTGTPKSKENIINTSSFDIESINREEIKEGLKKDSSFTQNLRNTDEDLRLSKDLDKEVTKLQELIIDKKNQKKEDLDLPEDKPIEKLDPKKKEDVITTQKLLASKGYDLNPYGNFENEGIDGKLGKVTQSAIDKYNQSLSQPTYNSYKKGQGFLGNCQEKQCSEFVQNENFRNLKPNLPRQKFNEITGVTGDAWTIGKNIVKAGGEKVPTNKVKEGDFVTLFTGGRSPYLNQAKKAGTDATHTAIIDKVNPDGSYYILHNVHEIDYAQTALKGSKQWKGKEYRDLVKDGKIISETNNGFTVRDVYRPNYEKVKEFENKFKVRDDVALVVDKESSKKLQSQNKSYTGVDIEENTKSYLDSLNRIENKKTITLKHGLTETDYQSISKVALGILGQETGFGTSDKANVKRIGAEVREFFGGTEASRGDAQIKYETNFGDRDLPELGINKNNFTEKDKVPLVVVDIIAGHYKYYINKGESKEKALYKAVEKYNRGRSTKYSENFDSDYVNKVLSFADYFDVVDDKGQSYKTLQDKLITEKNVIRKKLLSGL